MPGSEGLGGVVPAANAPSGPVAGIGVQPGASSRIVTTQVTIIGSGGELLVYSPTRALGNLTASIAGSAAFDSVGNFFLSNITAYQDDGGTWLATQIFGGGIAFYTAPGPGSSYTQYAAIGGTTVGTLLQAGGGSGAIAQFPPAVFGADGIAIVNALIAAGIFV
jgi:hypothetical protein